jgi:hypothetical protein
MLFSVYIILAFFEWGLNLIRRNSRVCKTGYVSHQEKLFKSFHFLKTCKKVIFKGKQSFLEMKLLISLVLFIIGILESNIASVDEMYPRICKFSKHPTLIQRCQYYVNATRSYAK